ncbi:hypothetical protein ZWY2020_020691 [Hordeum vulgare]|nr:hypothetical protein ZWY2020_020691 [Hordeum vulgare]
MPPLSRWFPGSRGDAINGGPVVRAQSRTVAAGPLVRRLPRRHAFTPGELRRPAAPSPPLPSRRYIYPSSRRSSAHPSLPGSPSLPRSPSSRRRSRAPKFFLLPCFRRLTMDHAEQLGGAPESNWPQSLDKPLTQELYNFGLLVPPGCRLAKPWRICKDGYPMLDNPATPEQLRVHPGGRYNTRGRHAYWDGKNL